MTGLKFILASTAAYGVWASESLMRAGFEGTGVITASPRLVGRKKILTPNAAWVWAEAKGLPLFSFTKNLSELKTVKLPEIDFLLVVDFGYFVPEWLVKQALVGAVNIHPSLLPKYRGASPGQLVLKNGDKHSAISIMMIAPKMDAGDLLSQIPVRVDEKWTAGDYYDFTFRLASVRLPQILEDLATGKITPVPQEGEPSYAPKISKGDAFVTWEQVKMSMEIGTGAEELERLIRAFSPWPRVWTLVATNEGEKRLQLLKARLEEGKLVLEEVKLEGEKAKPWMGIKQRVGVGD